MKTVIGKIVEKYNQMFFWFGIQLFDSKKYEYGGFNHFIAGKIFRWKYNYFSIALVRRFKFEKIFESKDFYYDGYHNSLHLGFIQISFGT